MTPHKIKRAVASRGMTFRGLSREHGYTGLVFSQALRHPYARVERILSDILQIPLHEMFPDRWSCDGKRAIRRGRPRLKKCVYTIRGNLQPTLAEAGHDACLARLIFSKKTIDKQK